MYIIYKHTSPNNKSYIGLTKKKINERFAEHFKANSTFGNAIRKYGKSSFKSEILMNNIETLIEAQTIETYFIITQNTFYEGYNMTKGQEFGKLVEKHPDSIIKQKNTWKNKSKSEIMDKELKRKNTLESNGREYYDNWILKMSEVTSALKMVWISQ